ncbi:MULTISPECIES: contact-dependent growth inhibition system immunity protein [Aneurinibacillus]|uniref:Uncharacterized protein n=1 Tax=Aneurinibacillus thermoaerophilus TaxID=143495 RepID=A0A1G8EED0_ANETH|nr:MULTISPECIES: contact-dependent growth inhibition system immunity protein [Aneurinibacillus]AMA71740.1 hypothetical protein ACH33_02030 [Aneurinibacillus sp. XH2]MED0735615.1 contact-dependent growth inhibition system immunity protein [Aneurinibacillus thermoaerophilus]MED0757569.1 contact-dependent growth inhibition system immunity protein [Aneurinibacillus thermoaerophilus]MED0761587.1 contact-dependent growth inhibition system immunity protein [Aneurinibacillus thermoaerophilus]QYY42501.
MKTIKDIYNISQGELKAKYALDIWYNTLIEKTVTEIDITDICRMLRQEIFIELAIERALEYLKQNPLIGDVYDGQLLELLSSVDVIKLKKYKKSIKELLFDIKTRLDINDFFSQEDYIEYVDLLEKFLDKLDSR